MDPHGDSDAVKLIQLHIRPESAGISQHESVAVAVVFIRPAAAEDHERVFLVAGCISGRLHCFHQMGQTLTFYLALKGMLPVKMNQIPPAVGDIQRHG